MRRSASPSRPVVRLGDVAKVSYGLQKYPGNRPGTHARPYLRVANVQRSFLDLTEIKQINVPDEEMHRFRLEPNDVLLCEGNSPDLVGRGAIWRGEIVDCVHQNHVLRVRPNVEQVLPEFILAVVNSASGQSYFRANAKQTTNLASINSREVASMPIPLVKLEIQRKLVLSLSQGEDRASACRKKAMSLRVAAGRDFENSLFSPDA